MEKTISLFVVPTPIGNLNDITLRALHVLKTVDYILAEDTRTTHILLRHFAIETPVKAYHQHNEHHKTDFFLHEMKEGKTIALVSDAGTPGISDPGYFIIRKALQENIAVQCLPGATAFVPALVQSGIPCDSFVFEGFPPHKKGRQTFWKKLANEERTIVLYESTHRLLKALEEIIQTFGASRKIAVSRELTKKFEETICDTATTVLAYYQQAIIKGEFVIIIEGKNNTHEPDELA